MIILITKNKILISHKVFVLITKLKKSEAKILVFTKGNGFAWL